MENNNFTAYQFENYDVEGLKLEINFSNTDFIEIKTHEEINTPIENIEESFDPLLFGIDMNIKNIGNINDLRGKKIILLDGHHRYEYLKRNNIDKSIELVLISIDDVEILSYPAHLTIGKKEFEEILENYNFSNNVSSEFYVSLDVSLRHSPLPEVERRPPPHWWPRPAGCCRSSSCARRSSRPATRPSAGPGS